jgi:GTP 3',8-cyclase
MLTEAAVIMADFFRCPSALVDSLGRVITYLRVSVTDRCDLRCVYCMSENTRFVPRSEVLSLEEMDQACSAFVALGVRKLRLTGGEPLVRPDMLSLVRRLGRHLDSGALDELVLTTNGSRLALFANDLFAAGIRRVNVSLDTLDPERFRQITRHGDIKKVFGGLAAARAAGLEVKINCVAMQGVNDDEFDHLIGWCGQEGYDLTLIERMPFGAEDGYAGAGSFLPLLQVRRDLESRWTFEESRHSSGGPARYVRIGETGRRLGFISALSQQFCDSCNRVRLTALGTLSLCLGRPESVDLRSVMRSQPDNQQALVDAIRLAMRGKPESHDFPSAHMARPMSMTGG